MPTTRTRYLQLGDGELLPNTPEYVNSLFFFTQRLIKSSFSKETGAPNTSYGLFRSNSLL